MHIHSIVDITQASKMLNKTKTIGGIDLKYETLASLTWKELAKDSHTQTAEHSSSRNRLMS